MKKLNIHTWNRKAHFNHFNALEDPYFAVTVPFEVSKAYRYAKQNGISFFGKYLHDCMKAINNVENFKYRIENNEVIVHDVIHASATLMRSDNTFGFSFINFDEDLGVFLNNINKEKERIENGSDLYPPDNTLDCIYCSALPWFSFTGHKEPFSGITDSVPKFGYSKFEQKGEDLIMNVSINVNHALVDGYHVGLFCEAFQKNLNINKV